MDVRESIDSTGLHAHKPRLLLIGPRIIENNVIGGDAVQFERLIDDLRGRANAEVTVISTARPLANRGRLGKAGLDASTFLKTVARLWRHVAAADLVAWYVSSRGAILSGGFLWLVCAIRGRPLGIRFFGGNFDAQLASAPAIWRFIAARTFLRAEVLLARPDGSPPRWARRSRRRGFPTRGTCRPAGRRIGGHAGDCSFSPGCCPKRACRS